MRSKEGDSAGQHSERLLPEQHVDAAAADPAARSPRLVSLDIVRGFTVATMVFVDNIGSTFNTLNHSPWNGITLADIVMPWFLFMVGVAMSISFRKFEGADAAAAERRADGLSKLCVRSFKLFLLGLVLQGGDTPDSPGFPDPGSGRWGWNLRTMRWAGILQRIAFSYFVVGLTVLYVPARAPAHGAGRARGVREILSMHRAQWGAVGAVAALYLALMHGTAVPDWTVADTLVSRAHGINGTVIACGGVRGDLGPTCNAAGYWDRLLLGQNHMYQPGEKVRLPACSTCAPGQCWDPQPWAAQPAFCWAPFDPEGAVASLLTPLSTFIGVHFGNCIRHTKARDEPQRALLAAWLASAAFCLALGGVMVPLGWPTNKQLWSPSYCLLNAGMTGGTLLAVYAACDVYRSKLVGAALRPLQYLGMNALFVFVMGASDVFESLLGAVYWETPGNNLARWIEEKMFNSVFKGSAPPSGTGEYRDTAVAHLMFVLGKIGFWLVVSYILHRHKWYWKF